MHSSAFQYSNCHPNCYHSLRQVILTVCTIILTTWLSKDFGYLVCEKCHKHSLIWWHWYVHWHKYLLLRDELKILSKLQAFAGNTLCSAVCTNCFEKCTFFFANIKDDSRNAPKLLLPLFYWGWCWCWGWCRCSAKSDTRSELARVSTGRHRNRLHHHHVIGITCHLLQKLHNRDGAIRSGVCVQSLFLISFLFTWLSTAWLE